MIDILVAWDKLAGFETADEIAQFLMDQDVQAVVRDPNSCAISKWMKTVTGNDIITTSRLIGCRTDFDDVFMTIEYHTEAMGNFIRKFDSGHYPGLMEPCLESCCNHMEEE